MAVRTSFTPGSKAGLQFLNQLLQARNVDPSAAQAVFSQEGASGGIGDGGHAFGPGQFNNAGGVWTGKYQGLTPDQLNAAAWSRQGLTELANDVARVASGLHGQEAITNIVQRFERPADPGSEIARALAAFGSMPAPVIPNASTSQVSSAKASAAKSPPSNGINKALLNSLLRSSSLLKVPGLTAQPTVDLPQINLPQLTAPVLSQLPASPQVTLPSFAQAQAPLAAPVSSQAATAAPGPPDIATLATALRGAVNATAFR